MLVHLQLLNKRHLPFSLSRFVKVPEMLNLYLFHTCNAAGLSLMTSAACLRALLALCSPSAAITWGHIWFGE